MLTPTEAQTRKTLIDPALTRAGWDLDDQDQVRFEIPVDDAAISAFPPSHLALPANLNPFGPLIDGGEP